MQQVINFENSAKEQQPIDVRATIQCKIKSLNLWLHQKQNKKNKANICNFQNFLLSLPMLKNSCNQLRRATVIRSAAKPGFFIAQGQAYHDGCLPVNFLALRSIALFFSNGESSRHPYQGSCMLKNSNNMATTINATRAAQRAFSLKEWMNGKSNFYSQIAEFPVTRLLAIRINLLSLCVFVAAVAIEQQPVFSLISTLCAGYLVYRINKSDKNQRSLTEQGRKGGKA